MATVHKNACMRETSLNSPVYRTHRLRASEKTGTVKIPSPRLLRACVEKLNSQRPCMLYARIASEQPTAVTVVFAIQVSKLSRAREKVSDFPDNHVFEGISRASFQSLVSSWFSAS